MMVMVYQKSFIFCENLSSELLAHSVALFGGESSVHMRTSLENWQICDEHRKMIIHIRQHDQIKNALNVLVNIAGLCF